MKKLVVGFLALGFANFCQAQTSGKKEEAKFPPPVIKKTKPNTKSTSTAKFPPPVIKKDDKAKFPPPVLKEEKAAKKSEKVKFAPPVIKKD